jgi:hypothetical protein
MHWRQHREEADKPGNAQERASVDPDRALPIDRG